jgi:hypothetical protein
MPSKIPLQCLYLSFHLILRLSLRLPMGRTNLSEFSLIKTCMDVFTHVIFTIAWVSHVWKDLHHGKSKGPFDRWFRNLGSFLFWILRIGDEYIVKEHEDRASARNFCYTVLDKPWRDVWSDWTHRVCSSNVMWGEVRGYVRMKTCSNEVQSWSAKEWISTC